MKVLLKRQLFAGGNRFRPNVDGVEMPDDTMLPKDAKVWDGKAFVEQPGDDKKKAALATAASKASQAAAKAEAAG